MKSAPVRVLMVVTQMNRAGIESLLMDLYREIDRELVQFDFYTLRKEPGQFDDEILSLGGKIYYNARFSVKKLFEIPKRIEQFCREHPEYQIVHAHMNQWCGWVLKGAKAAGVPIRIAHAHTSLVKRSIKNTVKNIIKLPTNRYATYKIAVSDKAGVWLFGKKAARRGEVLFWKNCIRENVFEYSESLRAQKREELELGSAFTLIHVGNLRHEKNHPFLFRVFAEVLKTHPDSRLLLVGRDMSNGALEDLATQLGIFEKTLFLGSRSDVSALLQAGDVFVFPSFYEGFPCAVLEAQTSGLCCVVSDTITSEVVVTALVEQRSIQEDPSVWAKHILSINIDERYSPKEEIIAAGYSLSNSVMQVQAFYLNVIKRLEDESR